MHVDTAARRSASGNAFIARTTPASSITSAESIDNNTQCELALQGKKGNNPLISRNFMQGYKETLQAFDCITPHQGEAMLVKRG